MSEENNRTNEDPWVLGNQYAQMLGAPPSSFTTLIRGLLMDRTKNDNKISFHHEQAMARFLRGDSMKAPFYYLLKTFKKGVLNGEPISRKEIVKSFEPMELAAFVGMLYSFRRVRGLIKTEMEWNFIRDLVITRSEIGAFIGYAIPNIGPGVGLISGGIRFLGLAPFILHDEKGFVDYRRHLKKQDILVDLDYEMSRWGCTHGHVAAHMLISLGFDKESAIAIGRGFLKKELPEESNGRFEYAVSLTEVWTTSLITNSDQPDIRHSGNFYPVKEDLANLISETGDTIATSSQFCWPEKQKSDISEENTPEIFDPNSKAAEETVTSDATVS